MKEKTRLFLILWVPGFAGVLTLLLLDIPALATKFSPSAPPDLSFNAIRALAVIQPTILLTVAVVVGIRLRRKLELSAPAAELWAEGGSPWSALRPQVVPGLVGGLIGVTGIAVSWVLCKPFFPKPFLESAVEFNAMTSPLIRFGYGGITEELLLRWGFMTFCVWVVWRLTQEGDQRPKPYCYLTAILFSSLLFAAGHLPIAYLLAGQLTLPIICFVMAANSIFGVVGGVLYWRSGLESAMVAHMLTHVGLVAALSMKVV